MVLGDDDPVEPQLLGIPAALDHAAKGAQARLAVVRRRPASAIAAGTDSLPIGSTQSWLIVAAEIFIDEHIQRLWDSETDRARELGIFGSPTFVVDGELFWGAQCLGRAAARHGAAGLCCRPDPGDRERSSETIRATP
jgi:hypothetical protein